VIQGKGPTIVWKHVTFLVSIINMGMRTYYSK
jgi:hypothetical protein